MDAEEREFQGTTTAGEETAAPETEVQEQAGANEEITLDESGELNIPDSFWEESDLPKEAGTEEKTEEPKPDYYTPEDFAEAYRSGMIDESKINPAILDYYKSVASVEIQRRDAAELQRQAMEQARQSRPQQQAQPLSWDQLMEAGKILASRYLGIKAEEFDEFDSRHQTARMMAVGEIRERVQAHIQQEQASQRAYQERVAGVSDLYAEYRQKVPEMDEISERFFPVWRQNLTMQQHEAVNQILSRGNAAQLRQLFDAVVADYKAYKTPKTPKAQPKAPVSPPPSVISTMGAGEGEPGAMVDISNLGSMSPDEQAEFLIKNKFLV